MAKWLGCWTCILVVSGSSPSPCHLLDLFLVALSSTPWWHHFNSQVVCLLLVGFICFSHCKAVLDSDRNGAIYKVLLSLYNEILCNTWDRD